MLDQILNQIKPALIKGDYDQSIIDTWDEKRAFDPTSDWYGYINGVHSIATFLCSVCGINNGTEDTVVLDAVNLVITETKARNEMKPSTKSASGTSFYGDTITTTFLQIKKAFPDAIDDGGDSGGKCYHGFTFEMDNGEVVTLYDWKEGLMSDDKVIDWHIGAHSKEASSKAKKLFETLITTIILI